MPTIFKFGSYRFFFYSGDRDEPEHIHVEKNEKIAKFWLDPVRLQRSGGFKRHEINEMQKIICQKHKELLEAWHDYFRN